MERFENYATERHERNMKQKEGLLLYECDESESESALRAKQKTRITARVLIQGVVFTVIDSDSRSCSGFTTKRCNRGHMHISYLFRYVARSAIAEPQTCWNERESASHRFFLHLLTSKWEKSFFSRLFLCVLRLKGFPTTPGDSAKRWARKRGKVKMPSTHSLLLDYWRTKR